ncbi:hypothetical protein Syun_015166 [Stephania yunnanensis]|uniref:Uncharacterized protein n=1 Tax=Stephania yunnanensis TaxID=152371 RepID=A0AAP0PCK3_9MAGN
MPFSSSLTRSIVLGPSATSRLALAAMSVSQGPRGLLCPPFDFCSPSSLLVSSAFSILLPLSLLSYVCVLRKMMKESNEPELKKIERRFLGVSSTHQQPPEHDTLCLSISDQRLQPWPNG